jgi:hypothetical protein
VEHHHLEYRIQKSSKGLQVKKPVTKTPTPVNCVLFPSDSVGDVVDSPVINVTIPSTDYIPLEEPSEETWMNL